MASSSALLPRGPGGEAEAVGQGLSQVPGEVPEEGLRGAEGLGHRPVEGGPEGHLGPHALKPHRGEGKAPGPPLAEDLEEEALPASRGPVDHQAPFRKKARLQGLEEGPAVGREVQGEPDQAVDGHLAHPLDLPASQKRPLRPGGEAQGGGLGEDLPGGGELGEALGQVHRGPRRVGSPAYPLPKGPQRASPLATPARAGKGSAGPCPRRRPGPARARALAPRGPEEDQDPVPQEAVDEPPRARARPAASSRASLRRR